MSKDKFQRYLEDCLNQMENDLETTVEKVGRMCVSKSPRMQYLIHTMNAYETVLREYKMYQGVSYQQIQIQYEDLNEK
jgi:hypothetical protein